MTPEIKGIISLAILLTGLICAIVGIVWLKYKDWEIEKNKKGLTNNLNM